VTQSGFHKRAGTEGLPLHRGGIMTAARVAELGYEAFQANKRVKVTGALNSVMAHSVAFAPRAVVLRTARQLLSH
jgi:short-subunit dehydrogenase